MSFLGYSQIIPYTKFEHFGDLSFLSYAPDKQTDRQRNKQTRTIYPYRMPTDYVGVTSCHQL